jgi:hypothetical protein
MGGGTAVATITIGPNCVLDNSILVNPSGAITQNLVSGGLSTTRTYTLTVGATATPRDIFVTILNTVDDDDRFLFKICQGTACE